LDVLGQLASSLVVNRLVKMGRAVSNVAEIWRLITKVESRRKAVVRATSKMGLPVWFRQCCKTEA